MVLMLAFLAMGLPSVAQKSRRAKHETWVKKVEGMWNKAKTQVS